MTKEQFQARYRDEMACVRVSPQLRAQTLHRMKQKEEPVMKKKLSAALVFAIVLMICAVAVAVSARLGIVDFAGRIGSTYVPEDAQDYVQSDVLHLENDLVTVDVRELYYDGLISRMTVDVKPKDGKTLLLAEDVWADDPWINMTPMAITSDGVYTETVLDAYLAGGYESAYCVAMQLSPLAATSGGTGNHTLNEDGTLTLYQQWEYISTASSREMQLELALIPYTDALANVDHSRRIDLSHPLTLTEAAYDTQTLRSAAPIEYPSVGVRVDQLTLEVRAQDIHAIIDFTVTDQEKYAALDGGLWFEFIDPNSAETEPYRQQLPKGMSATGSISPLDERTDRFRQMETLGRNECYDAYTLRAFDAWTKERYESHTIAVKPAE